MQIVTNSLRLARRQVVSRHKRLTHRRHRRAVKMWLKSGRPVRNLNRPLAERYLE
jgi:hypothetical protein